MTITPASSPEPEDVNRGLAELERYVAAHAPAPLPASPAPEVLAPVPAVLSTRRVRALRAEVAEARQLIELQDDDAPLLIDTPKVRRRRKAAGEAARLHALAQDPTMRAWQAARMRRLLVAGAMVSLTLALAWSTAGVQKFAADGGDAWSPGWVFAWLVEPFMSLALLVVVGARAYLATLGQPIVSKVLVRIEWLFLALTLGMNAFPYLPGVAEPFSFPRLVLHVLGPIVAVAVVTALPVILAGFTNLDHGGHGDQAGNAGQAGRSGNPLLGRSTGQTPGAGKARGTDVEALVARTRALISIGEIPDRPSAARIRRVLGCGMDTARAIRDALEVGSGRSGGVA